MSLKREIKILRQENHYLRQQVRSTLNTRLLFIHSFIHIRLMKASKLVHFFIQHAHNKIKTTLC